MQIRHPTLVLAISLYFIPAYYFLFLTYSVWEDVYQWTKLYTPDPSRGS